MTLTHQRLDDIMAMLAHPSPELGGSSACIVAGLMGISMLRMALAVTMARTEDTGAAQAAQSDLEGLVDRLSGLAERDRQAFQALLGVMKDKSAGKSDLQDAIRSTLAALFAATDALADAQDLTERSAHRIARPVESDLFGGAALLDAALSGMVFAIRINMRLLHAPEERSRQEQKLVSLDARRKKAYGLITKRAGAAGFGP